MNNRILEIVVFLMDYLRDSGGGSFDSEDLSISLKSMGYSEIEISSAYSWLVERFDNAPEKCFADFPATHNSVRVLSPEERALLTSDGYGYLLKLLNLMLIGDEQFEEILDRVLFLGTKPINAEQVKLVASTVLFRDLEEMEQNGMFDIDGDRTPIVN